MIISILPPNSGSVLGEEESGREGCSGNGNFGGVAFLARGSLNSAPLADSLNFKIRVRAWEGFFRWPRDFTSTRGDLWWCRKCCFGVSCSRILF